MVHVGNCCGKRGIKRNKTLLDILYQENEWKTILCVMSVLFRTGQMFCQIHKATGQMSASEQAYSCARPHFWTEFC